MLTPPHRLQYEPLLRTALAEDLGVAGDLTTDAIVPADAVANGALVLREAGRPAGTTIAANVFTLLDPAVTVTVETADGTDAEAGAVLARIDGPARALLTGERTALNLLGRLSGIATATARLVASVATTSTRIVPTRKTTPGLRALERYATRVGGAADHRFGLDDAVLVKDNHIAVAGGITEAVRRVRVRVGHLVAVEVEVDTLPQLDEALELGVQAVLLDNMTPDQAAEAVARAPESVVIEASGGITPESAPRYAAAGVDVISVGWLTHSSPALDIGLDMSPSEDGAEV